MNITARDLGELETAVPHQPDAAKKAQLNDMLAQLTALWNTGLQAAITAPAPGAVVNGVVNVTGTAAGPAFLNYRLDHGFGASPTSWTLLPTRRKTSTTSSSLTGVPACPRPRAIVTGRRSG